MPLTTGTRLGPYEILGSLGAGGMGEVYRARDTRLGRDVAIKVLPERTLGSPDALARFEREARAVAALNHPNILALHDVGTAGGVSYAVTELLEGETLRDRLLRAGALPPRKALDLAIQFARGLAAAHGRGIIHRDLKPENVFITTDGRTKILDFGLALQDAVSPGAGLAETRLATEPGLLVGTVGYMAPEQVRGEPATVRSDIFSFGLVVYEMLVGSNPFRRATTAETMAAILRDQPEPLVELSVLPRVAARLIDRCLEQRAEDRPESARDLAFALDAAIVDSGREVERGSGPAVSRRQALLAAAGVCGLIVLLTAAMWGYVRASANRAADALVTTDLARAESLVLRAQQDRLDRLQLTSRLVASFPEIKALFETDAPTIRDFLQTYQQRNPGTPLLAALGANGYVLARTDEAPGREPEQGTAWLAGLFAAGGSGILVIDGRPFHAAASAAEAGGTIFGHVIAAAPVDQSFAQVLREITEDEAVLLESRGVAGSSLRAGQVPWPSLDAFRAEAGPAGVLPEVRIGANRYTAREINLGSAPPVSAVIVKSRDELTGPYRGIEAGLLTLGLGAVLLVLAATLAIQRRWHPAHLQTRTENKNRS